MAGNIPIDGLTTKMERPELRTAEWMDRLHVYGVSTPKGVPKIINKIAAQWAAPTRGLVVLPWSTKGIKASQRLYR